MENLEILYENSVDINQLADGAYVLTGGLNDYSEAVQWATAPWNMIKFQRLRLPTGKANIIYLLTDTLENSYNLITGNKFIVPPNYKRFFYPTIATGSFFNKRYRLNLTKERQIRMADIKSSTKLTIYPTKKIANNDPLNIFFTVSDLYALLSPIIKRFPLKRISLEFFKEFDDIINSFTPPYNSVKDDPNSGNRILIFDAESFGFKNGAKLEENKTNPLFILYMAYHRNRSLVQMGVDRDMLITSGNMFLKFNPIRLGAKEFPMFRAALFRIMKANLDDYNNQLSDSDKSEVEDSDRGTQVDKIVDQTINPLTKYNSPAIKNVLATAITDTIQQDAIKRVAKDTLIKNTQLDIAKANNPQTVLKAKRLFDSVLGRNYTSLTMDTNIDVPDDSSDIKGNKLPPSATSSVLTPAQRRLSQAIIRDSKTKGTVTGKLPKKFTSKTKLKRKGYVEDEDEVEENEEEIEDGILKIIEKDKDVAGKVDDEIQDKITPMNDPAKAQVNSPKDKKIRDKNQKVVVSKSKMQDILAREANNVPIETEDKTGALTTANTNFGQIKFFNFDKTYLNSLYVKDIIAAFDSLKTKQVPLYIKTVSVEDSSTALTFKETWKVTLVDKLKQNHTVVIDLPKYYQNKFMRIEGNKYIILKQNYYLPIVKDASDTVVITTNIKMFLWRRATKSFVNVERIFSLIKKMDSSASDKIFVAGNCSIMNKPYISSLEYDEFAARLFSFYSNNCFICFNRKHIADEMLPKFKGTIKGDEFLIGFEGNIPILINEDTGLDRNGRSIVDIITANLPPNHARTLKGIKGTSRPMLATMKVHNKELPVATILIIWVGITKMLNAMGITWNFRSGMKSIPSNTNRGYVKFLDGVLEYDPKVFAQLILNGLGKMSSHRFNFNDFNTEKSYSEYLHAMTGTYGFQAQLLNTYQFMMDPITVEVCKDFRLPTDGVGLLIHAVKMLDHNAAPNKAYDGSFRVRSFEIVPHMLYSYLKLEYASFAKSGYKKKFSLDKSVILKKIQTEPTIEEYSTLNPAVEVSKTNTISAKGYTGSNSDRAYDEAKRSYDSTSIGKASMSTNNDANAGVKRELTVEPTIANARGYRDPVTKDDYDTLDDSNLFSPSELLTPGTVTKDDPTRVSIANKQSSHVVPTSGAAPSLISNGYDEAIRFHLSSDFVVNAEDDGVVIEIDAKTTGMMIVQYKTGKYRAININPEVVKNSGGGFYLKNQLTPAVAVKQKFKKDQVLAYHDRYFQYSKVNGLRYTIGPLIKVAFISTYNTYEDAGICTQKLAKLLKTSIVYPTDVPLSRNMNVSGMVKVGDTVQVGSTLIKYEPTYDNKAIMDYISALPDSEKVAITGNTKNNIRSKQAGKVVDIKVISAMEPADLSPSLGAIVKKYFNQGNAKKRILNKYDKTPGTLKAGHLLTDSTEPIRNRYHTIKGYKGCDVLIEFYVESEDIAGVGDKVALYSANKQIISELIPEGFEPFSEHNKDEEISCFISPGSVSRRMTASLFANVACGKVLVELKRKIKTMI